MKATTQLNHFEMALKKYNEIKLKGLIGKVLSVKEQAFIVYFDNQVVRNSSDETTRLQFLSLFNTLLD